MENDKLPLSGLARRLVLDGLLAEELAHKVQIDAKNASLPFLTYLIQNKLLSAAHIAHAAANDFGLPLFDLDAFKFDLSTNNLLAPTLIQKHRVLPLIKRNNRLYVAVSDPTDFRAFDEIKFSTGLNIQTILVEENKLGIAIKKMLNNQGESTPADLTCIDNHTVIPIETPRNESDPEDAPIVRYVHKILLDAINQGASDIHFEPYEKNYRIRYRIDGILYEVTSPPANFSSRLASRLKVMAKLDIAERRLPQDGRFQMMLNQRCIDFRVNTCPTLYGEKVVLRILDSTGSNFTIEDLGFEVDQKEKFLEAIHRPQGMILVTGPTGSGKTVTLYTALGLLNTTEVNISTIEDPVEINVAGINQVHVNLRAGLTFASALRAFLRQDPDIIMVGEIRDLETAEIGVKAAQTGHLVLSTLHTNSAAETLTRLINMGVAPFNIATSVKIIMAQRLVRRLCNHCKIPEHLPPEVLLNEGYLEKDIPTMTIYAPNVKGCEHCTAGYKGRTALYEVMPITEAIGQIIMAGANALDILAQAKQDGMRTLHEAGLLKVKQGVTSLEEINRVA